MGQGIATEAQERLLREMEPLGLTILDVACREDNAEAVAFSSANGFIETMRQGASVLDVAGFGPAPFSEARLRPLAAGIRLTTLAAEQDAGASRPRV